MTETHDLTVQILIDIRDEIKGLRDETKGLRDETKGLAVRVDALAFETKTGFAAVHDELRSIDAIVTMLEKRDRETDEDIRKDVRMLKERALRGAL